jgi:hypothetical protein
MRKEKVIKLCKKATKLGYITHPLILDLYSPGEDVLDYVIKFIINEPYPSEHYMIMGQSGYDAWEKAMNDYIDYIYKNKDL